uniref:Uncharacterized protein n=1 Tax=Rhizophora mucronata TaxID=61149 RepID=A0A2P2IKR6_RHIMU
MASAPRYSYQRLKHEGLFDDYEENQTFVARPRNWIKFRRMHVRRRSLRLKVPSLSRFLRRKFRVVRVSCTKVLKRLKEGKAHFGDIFGGNYLFIQINPTPLKCLEKSYHWHCP